MVQKSRPPKTRQVWPRWQALDGGKRQRLGGESVHFLNLVVSFYLNAAATFLISDPALPLPNTS